MRLFWQFGSVIISVVEGYSLWNRKQKMSSTLQRRESTEEIADFSERNLHSWRTVCLGLKICPSAIVISLQAELICSLERRYTNQFCGFICVFVLLSGGWWFFLFVWLYTWNCISLIIQVVVYFVVGTTWIEILSKNCEQYRFGNTASFCKQYSCFYLCGPSGHTFYDIFVRNLAFLFFWYNHCIGHGKWAIYGFLIAPWCSRRVFHWWDCT